VKGRYGFDYVQHKHRLTKPLIRKPGMKKHKDFTVDPDNWVPVFASELGEALDFAAKGLLDIRDTYGKKALGGLRLGERHQRGGLSFQKLVRPASVEQRDHARACATLERRGADEASTRRRLEPGARRDEAEVIFLIGSIPP